MKPSGSHASRWDSVRDILPDLPSEPGIVVLSNENSARRVVIWGSDVKDEVTAFLDWVGMTTDSDWLAFLADDFEGVHVLRVFTDPEFEGSEDIVGGREVANLHGLGAEGRAWSRQQPVKDAPGLRRPWPRGLVEVAPRISPELAELLKIPPAAEQ